MIDKVLHFLGGATFAIPTRHPIIIAFLAGVGVEVFEVITRTGHFDYWDILATGLGGTIILLWNKVSGER